MTRLLGIEQIMFGPSLVAVALGPAVYGSKRVEPVGFESDEFCHVHEGGIQCL